MSHIGDLFLRELAKNFEVTKSGDEWHGISCPFHPNSGNKKHLYIRVPEKDDDTLFFMYCFKPQCNVNRPISAGDLNRLRIRNAEIRDFININHTNNLKTVETMSNIVNDMVMPSEDRIADHPNIVQYFERRTGKNLIEHKEYIVDLKIVSDIRVFLDTNKDVITLRNDKRLKKLYKYPDNQICFLNKTGTRLYVRYFDSDIKHAKINLVTLPLQIKHANYTIERDVHDNIKDISIFIGEGIFDIVNAYIHLSGNERAIFESSGTANGIKNSFLNLSKYYYDVKYYFLKDADVNLTFFKNMYNGNTFRFKNKYRVIFNELGKDLGDVSEPFKPKII